MSDNAKSFLDEGFDFIEESFSAEPLTYTEVDDYEISESEAKKSPYKILGRCCGNFQPIGVQSRNQRVYENDHWDVQLHKPEVAERIKSRSMWGTLGHFDRKITDEDVREGRISHVISVLETRRDNNGKPYLYGELEILDTPAGRILEAMYKGGANLYVSSRGAGKLVNVMGDPLKHVDKNSFYFEGFDIVKCPGFLQARPVYEGIPTEEAVSEAQINELDNKTVEADLDKRQDNMYDAMAQAKENPKKAKEAQAKYEGALNKAMKRAENNNEVLDQDDRGHHVHYSLESAEIEELKGQIDQLAKIIEKVVDDVYEEAIDETSDKKVEAALKERTDRHNKEMDELDKEYDEAREKGDREAALKAVDKSDKAIENYGKKLDLYKKKVTKECLEQFADLMASSNISEEAFVELLELLVPQEGDK